jgi:small redox-active disulfide protein 2
MEIKVLGTGCKKCKTLEDITKQAVAETGTDATIIKVEDMLEIMKLGVLTTPALVIDGKVVLKGRVPSLSEVKELLAAR